MSDLDNIDVTIPPELKFGKFVNAVRVVEEVGPDCFVDFLEYTAAGEEARVVARLRVRRDFLPIIKQKLGDVIEQWDPEEGPVASLNTVPRKNGETVH